eukprot:7856861-Alexandrium_andersonii.AAC.1
MAKAIATAAASNAAIAAKDGAHIGVAIVFSGSWSCEIAGDGCSARFGCCDPQKLGFSHAVFSSRSHVHVW